MYGSYWCSHCQSQKEMFGDVFEYVDYVGCAGDAVDGQPLLCQAKGVEGYPTWEINGTMFPGVMTLDELARLTGYNAEEP